MSIKRKKQSIVTKVGDKGYTYAYSGQKLSKSDLCFEVVGTMDELNSFLGMAKSLVKDKSGKDILERTQKDLFIVGSQISEIGSEKAKKRVSSQRINFLDSTIKK